MYTGTLIKDLMSAVERAQTAAPPIQPAGEHSDLQQDGKGSEVDSEPKQFAQALGLCPANGNLGLLLVVHPQLVGTLEPGHHLADTVDVHEIRAMSTPKKICVETVQQFLERPAIGLSLHPRCSRSHDCDHAVFDPRIADVLLIHQKHASDGF